MKELIYLLIGWSITSILVNGTIFDTLRIYLLVKAPTLHKLFSCMQCSGFWVGIVLGFLSISGIIYNPLLSMVNWAYRDSIFVNSLNILAIGFLISGISVLLNSLVVFFFSFERNSH